MRDILFRLEAEEDYISGDFPEVLDADEKLNLERGHILLLADAGLVELLGRHRETVRLTNKGHDFLASIRQDTTWAKTKEIAGNAGVKTIGVMFDVAVAIGKQKLRDATGLEF